MASEHEEEKRPRPHHVSVAVITTAGTFPPHGFAEVAEHQPVKIELAHASQTLGISDTNGWVATVGGRELNIEKNYVENLLTGKVEISWGPREGGGGCGR